MRTETNEEIYLIFFSFFFFFFVPTFSLGTKQRVLNSE